MSSTLNKEPDVSPFIPAVADIVSGCALENVAVIRCCAAAHKAFQAAVTAGKPNADAESEGADAYRRAMPPLDSSENVRNFIACVAHAMLIRILDPAEAPRLLYAAQCSVAVLRKPSWTRAQSEVP